MQNNVLMSSPWNWTLFLWTTNQIAYPTVLSKKYFPPSVSSCTSCNDPTWVLTKTVFPILCLIRKLASLGMQYARTTVMEWRRSQHNVFRYGVLKVEKVVKLSPYNGDEPLSRNLISYFNGWETRVRSGNKHAVPRRRCPNRNLKG